MSQSLQEQNPSPCQESHPCYWSPGRNLVVQQSCVRKGSYSEKCWGLIRTRRKSLRANRCWVGEAAAAVAEAEVEAWSGTVHWLEVRTCCYQNQMQTLLLRDKGWYKGLYLYLILVPNLSINITCNGTGYVLTSLCSGGVYEKRGLD